MLLCLAGLVRVQPGLIAHLNLHIHIGCQSSRASRAWEHGMIAYSTLRNQANPVSLAGQMVLVREAMDLVAQHSRALEPAQAGSVGR